MNEKPLQEKCGLVGVYSQLYQAPATARLAAAALQGRGREAAGIAVYQKSSKITTYTGLGLVQHVLTDVVITNLGKSHVAISHNRYATSGGKKGNAQPFKITSGKFSLALGQNGNLYDLDFYHHAKIPKITPPGTSDGAYLAAFLISNRENYDSWLETFLNQLPKLVNSGATNLVMITDDGDLWGVCDSRKIRPLVLCIL